MMKVAVLGFGELGQTVWEHLGFPPGNDADDLAQGLVLVPQGTADAPFQVTELEDVLRDESIGAVADCLDDPALAYDCAVRVLESGKHFVTADRVLVEEHGIELNQLARKNEVGFLFSGAFVGDIPLLRNMAREYELYDGMEGGGILSGACNYILDAMQRSGKSFAKALKKAKKLGYTGKDPSEDISGRDSLRKIKLACAVGAQQFPTSGTLCEGIESFTEADAHSLKKLGKVCRLTASYGRRRFVYRDDHIRAHGAATYAMVVPSLFPRSAMESSLHGSAVLAWYSAHCFGFYPGGWIALVGQGSGVGQTASSLLRDLLGILEGERRFLRWYCKPAEVTSRYCHDRFYVRCRAGAEKELSIEKRFPSEKSVARVLTDRMSFTEMQEFAAKRRAKGEQVFYASWNPPWDTMGY